MFNLNVLLNICLLFCQFQPGVAYKSVIEKLIKKGITLNVSDMQIL